MSYDFLGEEQKKDPLPSNNEGEGGKFEVGKNVFIDKYDNHLDAHRLFSTPPKRNEFNLEHNFNYATSAFSSSRIADLIKDKSWYGENTDYDLLVDGYTKFQDSELLNSTLDLIKSEIPENLFSELEKPKMKINDRFGMFSFDLASMAMTYIYEYFTVQGNEKVNADFVKKSEGQFYEISTNKKLRQEIKRRKNGTPVVVSSVRNCLIDFEKQKSRERSVEIFVINLFTTSEQNKDLLYNSIAALSVAENLIKKGFKVKITGLVVAKNGNNKKYYFHFVPVKNFNEPLDPNACAYVCGDPRFFRYQGFKMLINGYDEDNAKTPDGLGRLIKDRDYCRKSIENDYIPNSKLKKGDTRLYFGNSRNLEESKAEVKDAIKVLNENYSDKS
jgi:hypothetical protein